MTKRERVFKALAFEEPDSVPYHIGLTIPLREQLASHFGTEDLDGVLGNHFVGLSSEPPGAWTEIRPGFWRDEFGVVWDRTVDRDIGNPCEFIFPEPTLAGYDWPDPLNAEKYKGWRPRIDANNGERFVIADLGFSLFERAWTMRGMEDLLRDMILREEFVDELFDRICDWNLAVLKEMMTYPVDAVLIGDDWGQQRALIMGPRLWRRFILPRITRMYKVVRDAGRKVFIHSCGKVDELFDDLVGAGLECFNPFQPEVMDTFALARRYKGRLAFFGGISTQRLLPYGTPDEVRREVGHILRKIGAGGGYIASPAHDTPKDVPVENVLALWETLKGQ